MCRLGQPIFSYFRECQTLGNKYYDEVTYLYLALEDSLASIHRSLLRMRSICHCVVPLLDECFKSYS